MKNMENIGNLVLDTLLEAVKGFEYEKHSVTMKDPNSKYKLSSAVQKAIRRGRVQKAAYYAQAILHGGEGDYLWRRLPIVALEDIGLANMGLCAQVIHFCRFKSVRTAVGEEAGLTFLVEAMAKSVKSRTLCDMVCSVHYAQNPIKLLEKPDGYIFEAAAQIMTFDSLLTWGIKPEISKFPMFWNEQSDGTFHWCGREGTTTQEQQIELVLKNGGDMAAYSLYGGAKKSAADLQGAIYPAYRMEVLTHEGLEVVKTDVGETDELLSGIPYYAFDKHTLEGKKAIAYLMKSSKQLKEMPSLTFDAVALGIFQAESAVLDLKLEGKWINAIQKYNDELEFLGKGVPLDQHDQFRAILTSQQFAEDLMHARKRVLGLVPSSKH